MAQRHSKYIPLISLTGDFLLLNLLLLLVSGGPPDMKTFFRLLTFYFTDI